MHSARRRKKRPGNGLRTVEVARGISGFGFTISGQQPCILSCIVPGSPAERAGLRAGDYLVSVNGQNVSKASHEDAVRLIGGFSGLLQLQIADNYFSDSSDEDQVMVRSKPRHVHKSRHGTPKQNRVAKVVRDLRSGAMFNEFSYEAWHSPSPPPPRPVKEELCFFVGYLGTIEMPKEIQLGSRSQVVKGCIRRLRAEKRNHTWVVMRVHSEGVTLTGTGRQILAEYPVSRITFCGSSGEEDKKYLGLVTTPGDGASPSSSCHVFAVQSALVDHSVHEAKAAAFHIVCTSGERSETCFEFPGTSEPLLNAVKYFCLTKDEDSHAELLPSNSPQPSQAGSNAASSNSDSGIGFRDDLGGNNSDRIVMVDVENQRLHIQQLPYGRSQGGQSLDISLAAGRSAVIPSSNLQQAFAAVSALCPMAGSFDPLQLSIAPQSANRSRSPLHSSSEDSVGAARLMSHDGSYGFSGTDGCIGKLSLTKSSENLTVDPFLAAGKCSKSLDSLRLSVQVHAHASPLSISYGEGEMLHLHPRPSSPPSPTDISNSCKSIHFQSVDDVAVGNNDSLRGRSLVTQSCDGLNSPSGDRNPHHWGSLQDLRCRVNQFNRTLPAKACERKDGEQDKENENCFSSFEKLLEDKVGIQAFTEFLEKEFSQENIIFWTSCERYSRIQDVMERRRVAKEIFDTHLGENASESVNVDAQAQAFVVEHLAEAPAELFAPAQKQVFNLMKFDSYPRFVKSGYYQSRVKLKKSRSDAEDSRRKSLLPWARKNRSKSKDRGEFEYGKDKSLVKKVNNDDTSSMRSEITSSISSLASWDLTVRGSFRLQSTASETSADRETNFPLCRIILQDGATAVVQVHPDESIRELMGRVLEKRGLCYQAFEVFPAEGGGGGSALSLDGTAMAVANREIRLEQRVVFRLDLPNRKTVSVRSKTNKTLGQVLRPVLHKYGYQIELVTICSMSENEVLDMAMPILAADGRRLTVLTRSTETWRTDSSSDLLSTNNKPSKTFVKCEKPPVKPSLDEITNRVFEEVLSGKQHQNGGAVSEDAVSETSSSAMLPRFLRRDSAFIDKLKSRARKSVGGTKGKISNVPTTLGRSDSEELYEGLKRAQRSRLEDQRGTEINFELPDFLKDKENVPNAMRKIRKLQETDNVASEEDIADKGFTGSKSVPNVHEIHQTIDKVHAQPLTCKTYETATTASAIQQQNTELDSKLMMPPPQSKLTPPPLPPKPKNLANFKLGQSNALPRLGQENAIRHGGFLKPNDVKNLRTHCSRRPVYLDETSSSFV